MSELLVPSRRGFLGGLLGLIAAPAIVKATSLMPVRAERLEVRIGDRVSIEGLEEEYEITGQSNGLLTINKITREAIRMWHNTNEFVKNTNMQYDEEFAREGTKIGTELRIRLP